MKDSLIPLRENCIRSPLPQRMSMLPFSTSPKVIPMTLFIFTLVLRDVGKTLDFLERPLS